MVLYTGLQVVEDFRGANRRRFGRDSIVRTWSWTRESEKREEKKEDKTEKHRDPSFIQWWSLWRTLALY